MSPVIMKVSSSAELLAANPRHLTAVSRVFGNEFSNSRYRSGSLIMGFMLVMVSSTTDELNVRHSGDGLIYESW